MVDAVDSDKAERFLSGFSFLLTFVLFIALCSILNCFIEQYRDERREATIRHRTKPN